MRGSEFDGATAIYHRQRALSERRAAAHAIDERARRAHLELAMQHEIAMFRLPDSRAGNEIDTRPFMIGSRLRDVIALPDAILPADPDLGAPLA
ncbi:hypothetical protein ACH0CP_10130 [Sphingomonas sp. 179-I 2A4 NHS]|jgi:hypothetical protein|uniref:hypothetical protein n=2 Tax=Sphingomonas TaxID=13687 RepID=UPI00387964EC